LARLSCVYVRLGHGHRGWDLLRVIQAGLPTLRANNCLNSKHTSCLLGYYSDESVRCSVLGTIRHRTDMLRLARLSKPHSRACLPQIDRTKTARGDPRGISSRKNGIIISAKACLVNIGGCAQPKKSLPLPHHHHHHDHPPPQHQAGPHKNKKRNQSPMRGSNPQP
jgi:hypothetical protein